MVTACALRGISTCCATRIEAGLSVYALSFKSHEACDGGTEEEDEESVRVEMFRA